MNDLIKGYFERADYPFYKTRAKPLAETISFMVDKGMLANLTYQRFVNLMHQLEKIIYV